VSPVYCALVHYPVLDRQGVEASTSVTNVDVHDIARSARTYGLRGYFIVTPIEAQHPVIHRIVDHWRDGAGARRIPQRSEALALVRPCESIEGAVAQIEQREGQRPRLVATSAHSGPDRSSWSQEAERLRRDSQPVLLLFGTGYGLSDRVLHEADAVLDPISGPTEFNHLSVRTAAAITFDRLIARGF
jgi:hypothetical protein